MENNNENINDMNLNFYPLSEEEVKRITKKLEKAVWYRNEALISVGWNATRMGIPVNKKEQ